MGEAKRRKPVGYIVCADGRPLTLFTYKGEKVLMFGTERSNVTAFSSRQLAAHAIQRTRRAAKRHGLTDWLKDTHTVRAMLHHPPTSATAQDGAA